MSQKLSPYYVSCTGKLCITFPSSTGEKPELCEVVGWCNETWFKHKTIK